MISQMKLKLNFIIKKSLDIQVLFNEKKPSKFEKIKKLAVCTFMSAKHKQFYTPTF